MGIIVINMKSSLLHLSCAQLFMMTSPYEGGGVSGLGAVGENWYSSADGLFGVSFEN